MKLSARDQIILAAAVLLVAVVVLVVLLIVPQFREISRLKGEIGQAESDAAAARMLLQRRQSAKAQTADTQAQLLKLQNEVPDNPELPSLIIELQDTANEAGLQFLEVKPAPPAPGSSPGYSQVALGLSVMGRWSDCVEYLRLLGKLTRGIRVRSVSFQGQNTEGSEDGSSDAAAELGLTLTIEAYMTSAGTGAPPSAPPSGG